VNASTWSWAPNRRVTPAGGVADGSKSTASQLSRPPLATAFSLIATESAHNSSAFFSRPGFTSPQVTATP
jgi:hypothetical protein